MRQRQRDKKTYYLKPCIKTKDEEGSSYYTYGQATAIQASIQPASGSTAVAQYGDKITNIMTMYFEGNETIKENDGICVFVSSDSEPDYRVKGITPWDIKVFNLEKVI